MVDFVLNDEAGDKIDDISYSDQTLSLLIQQMPGKLWKWVPSYYHNTAVFSSIK